MSETTEASIDPRDAVIAAVTADRRYLWNTLADLEAFACTAPSYEVGPQIAHRIRRALDAFKPHLPVTRVMPPAAAVEALP